MNWLLKIRKKENRTQKEVSEYANITPQMYSYIENGERRPSVDTAKKIAGFLGFNWTRFYDNTEQ